ncbi:MAG: hypothetical protein JXO48_09250, partial [Deltaproteobacteria bacterium]|nr:hypothetical protein [Deltaproteobacteria bacterium]
PIENVYIFALLDVNGNGEVDGGDRIGYYSANEKDYPTLITIDGGETGDIDVRFYMDVMEPSGLTMSLKGSFSPPEGYDETAPPVSIILARADDPSVLFDDPLSAIKYFERLPAGEFLFDIDLSKTDFLPGDEITVIALWDRDYERGFPDPTGGDKIGYAQNKEIYAFTVELDYGVTPVPSAGYEFLLSKNVYDFDSSILYALDMSHAGSFDPAVAKIIVMALHVSGIEVGLRFPNKVFVSINMDYILALKTLPATSYDYIGVGERIDPVPPRNLDIFTALFNEITVWEENEPPEPLIKGGVTWAGAEKTAYLVAILDKNGNNRLDDDDEIGYYCNEPVQIISNGTIEIPGYGEIIVPDWFPADLFGTYYFPTPIERITRGDNREDRGDGEFGPFWIEMNKYYGSSLLTE